MCQRNIRHNLLHMHISDIHTFDNLKLKSIERGSFGFGQMLCNQKLEGSMIKEKNQGKDAEGESDHP